MNQLESLNVKIFADGAELSVIEQMSRNPLIKGFTTNPTLMRKAGVDNYCTFAKDVLSIVRDRPVSFEVFSDEFWEMEEQACEIASWGENVYVKIPVTNTRCEFSGSLLKRLSRSGVQVNVTALMTLNQLEDVLNCLDPNIKGFISIFAGRIADTGRDPVPVMVEAVQMMKSHPHLELIWASPRELLNIFQAEAAGCHVLTATNDILQKLNLVGKDLDTFSLETVQMFRQDALSAEYSIETSRLAAAV